jgi:hypothetical protein
MHLVLMLTAIDFKDQIALETDEVDDAVANRMLPAELCVDDATRPQEVPKSKFRVCGVGAKVPGVCEEIPSAHGKGE